MPLHDDLFDFFYEALPGYEEVGQRRILLGCWGSFQDPDVCDYDYRDDGRMGQARCSLRPASSLTASWSRPTSSTSISASASCSAPPTTRIGQNSGETFVKNDPLGNPVDKRHPWNQTTIPKPQKRDFGGNYTWVMSPRWLDKRTGDHLALDTGGGPIARLWATALAELVDIGYVKSTGNSVKIRLPKTALETRGRVRMENSEMEQRDRTRPRPHLFPGLRGRLRALLPRAGDEGSARRPHRDLHALQGAG